MDTEILSIIVAVDLIGSTLVGKRIVGRRPLEVNVSKKVSQSLLLLTFSKLQLKSPKTIAFFCVKLIQDSFFLRFDIIMPGLHNNKFSRKSGVLRRGKPPHIRNNLCWFQVLIMLLTFSWKSLFFYLTCEYFELMQVLILVHCTWITKKKIAY